MTRRRHVAAAFAAVAIAAALVTALPASEPAPERARGGSAPACRAGGGFDWACQTHRVHALAASRGPAAALAVLRREAASSDAVRAACHHLAHHIGHAAAVRHDTLHAVAVRGDATCGSGALEGAVEALTARIAARRRHGRELDALCAPLRAAERLAIDHWHCAHAIGHGLLSASAGDVSSALRRCDRLRDDRERRPCAGGVFMQDVAQATAPAALRGGAARVSLGRPFARCSGRPARHALECAAKHAFYALSRRDFDVSAVFALCGRLRVGRTGCHRGLGASAMYLSTMRLATDPGRFALASAMCSLGPRRAQRACVAGAVTQVVVDGRSARRGRAFCSAVARGLWPACRTRVRVLEGMIARGRAG